MNIILELEFEPRFSLLDSLALLGGGAGRLTLSRSWQEKTIYYDGDAQGYNNTICVGAIILKLDRLSIVDPLDKGNIGMFTYYDRNAFMSESHSKFKDQYLSFLEQLAKEFVVQWNKNNQ